MQSKTCKSLMEQADPEDPLAASWMPKPIVEYLAIVGNFTILIHEAGPKSNVTTQLCMYDGHRCYPLSYVFNMVIRFIHHGYACTMVTDELTMVTDVFTMVM